MHDNETSSGLRAAFRLAWSTHLYSCRAALAGYLGTGEPVRTATQSGLRWHGVHVLTLLARRGGSRHHRSQRLHSSQHRSTTAVGWLYDCVLWSWRSQNRFYGGKFKAAPLGPVIRQIRPESRLIP